MNLMNTSGTAFDDPGIQDFFCLLENELKQGLMLYWNTANKILDTSKVKLHEPSQDYVSLENNFFSALFLYSYYRAGISKSKRILFVGINQCLRGMVTGCDNILDNEYKQTLDTNLPVNASKFRSILDIMVSDRILVAIMHKGYQGGDFSFDHILQANTASLHALLQSGIQEASEEQGAGRILSPEEILEKIHPLKTGILFQAPWVLPELIEDKDLDCIDDIKTGLFQIGMGCQVLDDMVDLSMDAQMNRHNYVLSLIRHGENPSEQKKLETYLAKKCHGPEDSEFLFHFPDARKASSKKALALLEQGTKLLFDKKHQFMIPYSLDFIVKRIGAHQFF